MNTSENISDCQSIAFGNSENGRLWHFQNTEYQYKYNCKTTPNSTGKELDAETGFSYFGARYLDHTLTTAWLSVDPMADKYPSISPYAYCAWNPVKIIDPNGDTIKNAYEDYKDIRKWLDYFNSMIENTNDEETINEIKDDIARYQENNRKYYIVENLLREFESLNIDEYDIINNLVYKGKAVNVYVTLDDAYSAPITNAMGHTNVAYLKNNLEIVQDIESILIVLYKSAFADGYNGLSTLANEFGDALFGVQRAQYNYDTNIKENDYHKIPTTIFSYDYEKFIIHPRQSVRPNPYCY